MSKGNRKKKRRRQQAAARAAAQKKHAQAAAKPSEPEQGMAENSSSTLERDIEPVEQSVKSQESEAKAEASSKDASVEPVEEQAVDETDPESRQENMVQSEEKDCGWDRFPFGEEDEDESAENRDGEENFVQNLWQGGDDDDELTGAGTYGDDLENELPGKASWPRVAGIAALVTAIVWAVIIGAWMLFSGNSGVGVKSVSFENSELSVMVGQNETVVAVFESDKDQNIEALEKAIAKLDVEWSSTDASVVSVEEAEWESPGERAATLTAKKEGVAEITVSAGDFSDVITVTVVPSDRLEGINAEPMTLPVSDTWQNIPYTLVPEQAKADGLTFSIADSSVAEVDSAAGKIRGLTPGETTLTIQAGEINETVKVTVQRTPHSISAENIALWVSETSIIEVTTDINNPECGTNYTFTSEDENIAVVSENGVVTGVSGGFTEILVTNELGQKCTVEVEVLDYPLHRTDSTSDITITKEWVGGDTGANCYAAHIVFSDYTRFGTANGNGGYGLGAETTLSAHERLGNILTVSGDGATAASDYPVAREGSLRNQGPLHSDGVYSRTNGILNSTVSLDLDGYFLSDLVDRGDVSDTFQYKPAFLVNGALVPTGDSTRTQRTFIGSNGTPGDIWIVVAEGGMADGVSAGLTPDECASFLASKGCLFGMQLNEGGTAAMVYRDWTLTANGAGQAHENFVYFR